MPMISNPFDLAGRVAVISGGYGVLGGSMADGLAAAGARVAVLGRRKADADAKVEALTAAGGEAMPLIADVLDADALRTARDQVLGRWDRVDILINAAGGHVPEARNDHRPVFDVPIDAFDDVVRLNLHGTVLPSMIFGEVMARQGAGCIVNISSMASLLALRGVLGYSVAKAAIDNFTRWMAMEMAQKHGDGIRVNSIAPGFFLSPQSRPVMFDEAGEYTPRARAVLDHTPMGRFGDPDELIGPVHWLCSDAASFVTGTVIPVDGGFSIFGGV